MEERRREIQAEARLKADLEALASRAGELEEQVRAMRRRAPAGRRLRAAVVGGRAWSAVARGRRALRRAPRGEPTPSRHRELAAAVASERERVSG